MCVYSAAAAAAAAAAKSLQLCPILCDPIDGSPPGSLVPGILQARTLEGVGISLDLKQDYDMCMSVTQLFLTLRPCGLQPARLLCPQNSPDKSTGVGSHSFL